jgi:EspG family
MSSSMLLTLPDLRFLWQLLPNAQPLPVAFAVDPEAPASPVLPESQYRAAATARLVRDRYLEHGPLGLRLSWSVQELLRPLLWREREMSATIDVKTDSGTIRQRFVLATTYRAPVMQAQVYGSDREPGGFVVLTDRGMESLARVAVTLLRSMVPIRHAPFRIPVDELERAVGEASRPTSANDRDAFVAVLRRRLGQADARDLYVLARYGGQYMATFSAAAYGSYQHVIADQVVTVRETGDHQHCVVSEADRWTLIEPATREIVYRRLEELLRSAWRQVS